MKSLDIRHQYHAIDAALDLLGPAERSHFDDYRFYHPELDDFTSEMEDLAADVSLCALPTHPSVDLFDRIEKNIEELERSSLPARVAGRIVSLPWGWPVAACLAAAFVWAFTNQGGDNFANANHGAENDSSVVESPSASGDDGKGADPEASGSVAEARPDGVSDGEKPGTVKSLLPDRNTDFENQSRVELVEKLKVLERRLRELEIRRELQFAAIPGVSRTTVVMLTPTGQVDVAGGESPLDKIGDILSDGLGAFMPSAPSFEGDVDGLGDNSDSPDLAGTPKGGGNKAEGDAAEDDTNASDDVAPDPQAFFVYDEARGEGSLLLTGMDQPEEGSQYTLWTETDTGETIRLLDLPRGDALAGLYEINTGRAQVAPSNIYITLEPDNAKAPEGPVILRGAGRSAEPTEP